MVYIASAGHKNPIHHYNTNNQVAQYLNGSRPAQERKGTGRDHQKEIRLALKEMQASARLKRQEEQTRKPEAWKMDRFKRVQSKVKTMIEGTEATPDTPGRMSEARSDFLKRGTLTRRVNDKAAEARAKVMSPVSGGEAASVGLCSPRTEVGPRKPSVPKASELAQLAPRSNKNHIVENRRTAAHLHPPQPKEDDGPYRHKSFGAVPEYLQERKAEWAEEEARRIAALPDPDCPPGMRLLDEEERLRMLESLDETEEEVRRRLVRIPLQVDTPSMLRRREELERRLGEIARNRLLFSKPKVYIQKEST